MGAFACRFSVPSKGTLPYFDFVTDSESLIALFAETVIQTVSILNKPDYLKFYFRINT